MLPRQNTFADYQIPYSCITNKQHYRNHAISAYHARERANETRGIIYITPARRPPRWQDILAEGSRAPPQSGD